MADCQRYALWGSAGHAKVLADIIGLRGGEVVALFDNNPDATSALPGVPLFRGWAGFMDWCNGQTVPLQRIAAAVAIGGMRGKERTLLAPQMQAQGLFFPALVHPSAVLAASARLGTGCHVLAQANVAADVVIGDFSIVNHGANVDHECRLGSGVHLAPGAVLCGCVTVEENTMIGAGAIVLPRLRIGKGAVVGAGSVVTRDVPDGVVVAGNPARLIKSSAS